jgi:NAD+ kinase
MSQTIGLVLKPGVSEALAALETARRLVPQARFLVEEGGHHALRQVPSGVEPVDASTFEREVDLVLVLGGDGTLIHAASLIRDRLVPILGVNLGRIGFLAEVPLGDLAKVLPRALEGALTHRDRLRLDAEVWRDGAVTLRARILNDAVIAQLALARVAVYRVERDEELVTVVRGDGVIVSTPTGSTAYSMAAGGCILEPTLEAVAITPICPHALSQRGLVLTATGEIQVSLESDNVVFVTMDGQVGHEFRRGDTMKLRRAPVPTRLLTVPKHSHFETLRTKLRWGEGAP